MMFLNPISVMELFDV
jgi:hypothetical protein